MGEFVQDVNYVIHLHDIRIPIVIISISACIGGICLIIAYAACRDCCSGLLNYPIHRVSEIYSDLLNRLLRRDSGTYSATPATSDDEPSLHLPIFVYSSTGGDDEEKFNCAVCLAEFKEGDECRLLPDCLHRFHVACIDVWLKSPHLTCPLCRAKVDPKGPYLPL